MQMRIDRRREIGIGLKTFARQRTEDRTRTGQPNQPEEEQQHARHPKVSRRRPGRVCVRVLKSLRNGEKVALLFFLFLSLFCYSSRVAFKRGSSYSAIKYPKEATARTQKKKKNTDPITRLCRR